VLYGGEEIAAGKVWVPRGRYWEARKIGSCAWCARPQPMRRGAFDKRSTAMWLGAIALSIASTEVTFSRPCFRAGTCREGNPLLGNSRVGHYRVKLPVIALAWWGTAYLRAGDEKKNIGGMRDWWLLPLAYQAGAGISIIRDLAKDQPKAK